MRRRITTCAAICAGVYGLVTAAAAGTVTGKVTEEKTGSVIPGVRVDVVDEHSHTMTNAQGRFTLRGIPGGPVELVFSAMGYRGDTVSIDVPATGATHSDVSLAQGTHELPEMTVVGIQQGRVNALNMQKNADNVTSVISADHIGRYPDQNTAEALQRVSGITVQRDQGQGRYIQLRGSEPAMTAVTINGVQIPSPEGDGRSVALDVIPADALSSIEVQKAPTPEMDGGGVAGVVNLKTKKAASEKLTLSMTMAGGYNNLLNRDEDDMLPMNGEGSFMASKRFLDGALGLLAGGSYYAENRGSDNIEMEWDGDAVDEMELRDYRLTRDRISANATVDYTFSREASIYLSGIYNRFGDDEVRVRQTIEPEGGEAGEGELGRRLKDRYEIQDIIGVNLGGEMTAGPLALDMRVGYGYAQEEEPDRHDHAFALEDLTITMGSGDYDVPIPTGIQDEDGNDVDMNDASLYELDEVEFEDNLTTDQNIEAELNAALPFYLGEFPCEAKLGVKGRRKQKDRDNMKKVFSWEGNGDYTLDRVTGDLVDEDHLGADGKYKGLINKNMPGEEQALEYFENNPDSFGVDEIDVEDTYTTDYTAVEDVAAGYLQAKMTMKDLSVLGGVRVEHTMLEYEAYRVGNAALYEDPSATARPSKKSDETSYPMVLPMLHAKYALNDNAHIKAAFTRGFTRPDHWEIVPYLHAEYDEEVVEVAKGNFDLEPTTSWNADLLGEYFFPSLGVISAGIFYKHINNFIYKQEWENDTSDVQYIDDGNTIDVTDAEYVMSINGDAGDVLGVEFNLEKQFTFLPSFWNGFGIYGNYTYAWSEAEVEFEQGDGPRTIDMPGQADHSGNVALGYDKFGLSSRLSLNMHSAFLDPGAVGEDASADRYHDAHMQLDASASYTIQTRLTVFLELVNLTNEPMRYYQGEEKYTMQNEYYSWWSHFGIKYHF
jgi:TonB-dependent receptor